MTDSLADSGVVSGSDDGGPIDGAAPRSLDPRDPREDPNKPSPP
jgi:hypothetical protein